MVLHLEKLENIFEEAEPTGTFDTSRSEFLNLGSVDILDQIIYYCEVCPVPCGMVSSICLYHSLPVVTFRNVFRYC